MPMVGAPGEVREPDDQVHSITQQVNSLFIFELIKSNIFII